MDKLVKKRRETLDRELAQIQKERQEFEEKVKELEDLQKRVRKEEARIRQVLYGTPTEKTFGEEGYSFRPYSDQWCKAEFKLLEVTGTSGGLHVPARWFKKAEAAENYLLSLDWGNVWISDAWWREDTLCTGKRKRVRTLTCKCGESLKNPHPYCATKKQIRHIRPFATYEE
jgi:hypothetical protein